MTKSTLSSIRKWLTTPQPAPVIRREVGVNTLVQQIEFIQDADKGHGIGIFFGVTGQKDVHERPPTEYRERSIPRDFRLRKEAEVGSIVVRKILSGDHY
jgi:hypothetical protein